MAFANGATVLRRHLRALVNAWISESEHRKKGRLHRIATEFLPAALEVTEKPPSPIGRAVLWVIVISAVTALMWSCLSKVDEVAVAEGRLVPRGRLRSVEAADHGVIRQIAVHEGDHVNSGDLLIELDPGEAIADAKSAEVDLSTAALTRARDNAILDYSAGGSGQFIEPEGASKTAGEAERRLVAARISEYRSKAASLEQRRQAAVASARSIEAEIEKINSTLPLLKEQFDSEKQLAAEGFGARQKLLQVQQAYIVAQHDVNIQTSRLQEARAQVSALESDVAQAKEEFIGRAAQERAEAESGVAGRQQTLEKAQQRSDRTRLVSPISGIVQEVTVTTIGQSPDIGKPLVTLVADGDELVAEGLLLNRDAGFVRAGQPVIIKLEAYPFTRYGTIQGVVEHVSPDATVDEKRGLVFPIRVRLNQGTLKGGGQKMRISAGMATTLEVVIGRRTVIDYILSPLLKSVNEAAREK